MLLHRRMIKVIILIIQCLIYCALLNSQIVDGKRCTRKRPIICDTPDDCPDVIKIRPGQTLLCRGQNSCRGKTIEASHQGKHSLYSVQCHGSRSCAETKIILNERASLYCYAWQSCTGMSIESNIGHIYVYGMESYEANILDGYMVKNIFVYAAFGFAGQSSSKMATNMELKAFAAISDNLLSSNGQDVTIYASADPTVNVRISMTLRCDLGSVCRITCAHCYRAQFIVADNSKLELNCLEKDFSCFEAIIIAENPQNVIVSGDTVPMKIIKSRRLSQHDQDTPQKVNDYFAKEYQISKFNKPTEGFRVLNDEMRDFMLSESQNTYNMHPRLFPQKNCDGYKECKNLSISKGELLFCGGTQSCQNATISQVSQVFTLGYKSATRAYVSAISLFTYGYRDLEKATIYGRTIGFYGHQSARQAKVYLTSFDSYNTATLDVLSPLAVDGAYITCLPGIQCKLLCRTYQACKGAIYDCRKTKESCSQECSAETSCAFEVPNCAEINANSCNGNDWCFLANGQCMNREEESCASLSQSVCNSVKDVCTYRQGKCTLRNTAFPMKN